MPRRLTRGAFKKKVPILPPHIFFKLSIPVPEILLARRFTSEEKKKKRRGREITLEYERKRAFLRFHDTFGNGILKEAKQLKIANVGAIKTWVQAFQSHLRNNSRGGGEASE